MEVHTVDGKNIFLTISTLILGVISHITANDIVTYIAIGVGIATLVSYIQKIYYNWEIRRDRKRRWEDHHKH